METIPVKEAFRIGQGVEVDLAGIRPGWEWRGPRWAGARVVAVHETAREVVVDVIGADERPQVRARVLVDRIRPLE
jgi:hypothetical protein